jgi:hypothetical protein
LLLSEAAESLAAAGWRIFPVSAKSKRPRTEHGHLDASDDPEQIVQWAPLFDKGGAIATPTGAGLLVIDIDPRNGGKVPSWCPPTLTVHTQSGGQHLYYGIDEDVKSRAGLFGRGVDSKGAGGYVLMPPSPGYRWADVKPRAQLLKAVITGYMVPDSRERMGAARLAPEKWYRGIIHDQVVAWAAYFADTLEGDDEAVTRATWEMIDLARNAGTGIDNRGGHIDTAIRWVLRREGSKDAPGLA